MPTLPLYDPAPPHADGWHRVIAPGGYESWHFDAADEASDVRLAVTFSQGDPFDSGYLQQFQAFIRNPTRLPPPVPAGFPFVRFLLWEKGRLIARFASRYAADTFEASSVRPDVRIGPHRLIAGAGGTFSLTVASTLAQPRHLWAKRGDGLQHAAADLWFTPLSATLPLERPILSRGWSGADHRWIVASPLCAVSGTIRLAVAGAEQPREIRLAGRGYHDHRYGSGPICSAKLKWWLHGRVFLDGDRAEAFHVAVPSDSSRPAEICFIEADPAGVREVVVAAPSLQAARGIPDLIDLGRGRVLRTPTVLETNAFTAHVLYEAVREGRRVGTAFCEVSRGPGVVA